MTRHNQAAISANRAWREILASIPRITEDSDPGSTKQPGERAPAAQQRAELPMGEGSVIESRHFAMVSPAKKADASKQRRERSSRSRA